MPIRRPESPTPATVEPESPLRTKEIPAVEITVAYPHGTLTEVLHPDEGDMWWMGEEGQTLEIQRGSVRITARLALVYWWSVRAFTHVVPDVFMPTASAD